MGGNVTKYKWIVSKTEKRRKVRGNMLVNKVIL